MEFSSNKMFTQVQGIYPFSMLTDEEITDCLQYCEFLECKPGTRLFQVGDKTSALFFILDGEVKVTGPREKAVINNSPLGAGDLFGEEAIHNNTHRKTSAVCSKQTSLVLIQHNNLLALESAYWEIKDALSLLYQSWQIEHELVLQWLVPGEKIKLISRRHKYIPWTRLLFINSIGVIGFLLLLFASFSSKDFTGLLLVISLLVLLGGILTSVWAAAEWANDYFIITSGRVVAQRQVYGLFDTRQESPISAILSTGFDTSLMGRLIGYGTINLRSYTGEIQFKQLPFPSVIFDYLEYLRNRSMEEKKIEEKKYIQSNLANRLNENKPGEENNRQSSSTALPSSSIYQSGSFLDLMARFFQLRQVNGNSIIYRTHWWIMMKKTALPFVLLVILLIGFIGKLLGLFSSIYETTFYFVTLFLTFISALWWLYQYIDWYNDQYILTRDQLIDVSRKPLGYEDRRSAPVKNIQTVEYKRKGLIGLMLNFGTVRIQIGNEELTFDNVYSPSQIQGEVYSQLKKYQDEQQRLEGQRMAEWISTYDQIKKQKDADNSQSE
jgi:hypothetical protein